MCLYNFRSVLRALSICWRLERILGLVPVQTAGEAGGPGRLQRGWSRQARREGVGFESLSPVPPSAPWGTVLSWPGYHLPWHLSFRCLFYPRSQLPPHSSDPLPMGVLQAMVLYKSQTNPSLVTNFKKRNEVEKSGKQLFSISLYLLKRRRM